MCGIIGYLSQTKEVASPILEGLKRMEYRGYDSAGLAVLEDNQLLVVKKKGKLQELISALGDHNLKSKIGLGHIRWATHGEPSDVNAHPHTDQDEQLAVIHNGIIENYLELKDWLISEGYGFKSQTDSEVLANLISYFHKNLSLENSVRQALKKVRGAYGLAVISQKEPDKIIAARLGSPVVIGIVSEGEYLVASDVTALLPFTREVMYLNESEMAVLSDQGYAVSKLDGQKSLRKSEMIEWDMTEAEKGGYEHFMLKEIMEEPETVRQSLRGRVVLEKGEVKLGGLIDVMTELKFARRLIIVACGTAYYAGRIAEYIMENLVNLPVEVEFASEFRYREKPLEPNSVVLAISQSGETADTLAAIRLANSQKILTLGIVNVVGSSIARETKAGVYNHIGPEISVASTKAFISQVTVAILMAVLLGRQRGLTAERAGEILAELNNLPDKIQQILDQQEKIANLAKEFSKYDNFIYLGRKMSYPVALEGALKLKEISYIHAEGYPAGELKHGPLALIDENWPIVGLIPHDSVYEKMYSNLEEVKARQGQILAIASEGDEKIKRLTDKIIYMPKTFEILQPILYTIPLQLLAYYIAKERGCPIDQPKNLAKSVTVE